MGTASNVGVKPEDFGILPRVVNEIFDTIAVKPSPNTGRHGLACICVSRHVMCPWAKFHSRQGDDENTYDVMVQFLEIHNQDINDLLATPVDVGKKSKGKGILIFLIVHGRSPLSTQCFQVN